MTVIHVPNDSPEATRRAFESARRGDTVLFDAGYYVLDFPLVCKDRSVIARGQHFVRSENFDGPFIAVIVPNRRERIVQWFRRVFLRAKKCESHIEYCYFDGRGRGSGIGVYTSDKRRRRP